MDEKYEKLDFEATKLQHPHSIKIKLRLMLSGSIWDRNVHRSIFPNSVQAYCNVKFFVCENTFVIRIGISIRISAP